VRRRARTDDNQAAIVAALRQRKGHKYRAKPTVVDGIRFDSMKEARRYQELKLLEKAGEIHKLRRQPQFYLTVGMSSGALIGIYRADFEYCECAATDMLDCFMAHRVVEEVKGFKTPLYRWKKKHVEAQYGITIREV
jgi:hypothetical protein